MTDTTDLIQRLRAYQQADEEGVIVKVSRQACDEAADAIEQQAAELDALKRDIESLLPDLTAANVEIEQQAAQIEALQLTKAGLIGSLREEMDEGLRLRELGGALPDENITTMTERLIGERAALSAELSALRADAERLKFLREKSAYVGINPHARTCLWVLRGIYEIPGQGFDAAIDAALRQEQPAGEQPT